MERLLDPRNELVFKRIFGEHPGILRSFLNALLPFATEDEQIESLDYLPSEQVPSLPLFKNTIVDVLCQDRRGRQFIVEMQMNWTSAFLQRFHRQSLLHESQCKPLHRRATARSPRSGRRRARFSHG
ncbi:MAG: PD-(D/E)XK nuclease family transposase [Verrucomicrobia bacterium]|nr:PD-(D/E)XK nuclease family transposase [Verrucomicrobiota bacterium]